MPTKRDTVEVPPSIIKDKYSIDQFKDVCQLPVARCLSPQFPGVLGVFIFPEIFGYQLPKQGGILYGTK